MAFIFKINQQQFALDLKEVKEIVQMPSKIHSLPLTDNNCLGIFKVRENIYSLLGDKNKNYSQTHMVVVNQQGIGLVIDEVIVKGESLEICSFDEVAQKAYPKDQ
jgi:purine-binding chemotaxis protein CheW